jgi:hypothetical protein
MPAAVAAAAPGRLHLGQQRMGVLFGVRLTAELRIGGIDLLQNRHASQLRTQGGHHPFGDPIGIEPVSHA